MNSIDMETLNRTQITGDTKALTATVHNHDAMDLIRMCQDKNEYYKELIQKLRRQVDEAKDHVQHVTEDMMEKLEPTISHTRKNLHVAIITQGEENKKLQE